MSELSFGIDLGTTYSVVAYIDDSGRPSIARNADGAETTASVVFFETASNVVVGNTAKQSALIYPDKVVTRIKREMGEQRNYRFDGVDHTPAGISALILRRITQDAAHFTQSEIGPVVITVPAYFGMLERDATKKAGEIAGLEVSGIIPEPVAAALHYDVVTDAVGKTMLVYDLGGGTFDISVIRVEPDDIRVLCTDGDQKLGGADWDDALAHYLRDEFLGETGLDEAAADDPTFRQDLLQKAEDAKIQLSQAQSRPVMLHFGGAVARIEINRSRFEDLTRDLMDRTIDITRRALGTLSERHGGTKIDEVLLVGGSSKMPVVAARLREEFGWEPKLHEPDLAVAKGAALYAVGRMVREWQEDQEQQPGGAPVSLETAAQAISLRTGIPADRLGRIAARETHNVLAKAFGVRLVDSSVPGWEDHPERHFYVEHLVHANDVLPTGPRPLSAATAYPGQQAVEVAIYEQAGGRESSLLENNNAVNEAAKTISGIPPLPAGSPIDIEMSVDSEGLLEVTAVEPLSGKNLRIEISVSVLTDEQVEAARQVMSAITVSA